MWKIMKCPQLLIPRTEVPRTEFSLEDNKIPIYFEAFHMIIHLSAGRTGWAGEKGLMIKLAGECTVK